MSWQFKQFCKFSLFLALVSSSWGSHGVVIYMYIKYVHIQYIHIYMHLYLLFLSKGVNTDEYRTPLAPDQEKRTSCIHYATEESPTWDRIPSPHLTSASTCPVRNATQRVWRGCGHCAMRSMRHEAYPFYSTFGRWSVQISLLGFILHQPTGPTDWFIMVDTDLPPRYNMW